MNRFFVHLDTQAIEIPVSADEYVDGGSFVRFYTKVGDKRSTVAVFATHHVVAILKQHK